MSNKKIKIDGGIIIINEGIIKKGNTNPPPNPNTRPVAPSGQGGQASGG